MRLTLLLVLTALFFSACSQKKEIIKEFVYMDRECPYISTLETNESTLYDDVYIDYEVSVDSGNKLVILSLKDFISLYEKVVYLKTECRKKDYILDRYKEKIEEYNEKFSGEKE